ncbi:MAG TPA: cysteine dioxygenase family protein [Solirubrobacteraceae bacterium]|nr:cysteine dioxygenase family protein [Solirubrobacteraceae bacterium]
MSLNTQELEVFVHELAADTERWQSLVHHDPGQRTYGLLFEDQNVNAWVLCWSRDHDTGFHDHDVSAAAITVLAGHVREDRLRLGGHAREVVYGAGQSFTVPANAIHRVLHAGNGPAVTIHAYSPPLTRVGAYAVSADGELLRATMTAEEELRAELALD